MPMMLFKAVVELASVDAVQLSSSDMELGSRNFR
jgi:hypothetical protein